ncbi:hypothetical protein [Microcoleus sp. OTE_8_concoct_300]|uniref:hypothetical protein n=1 Tax=Microcoleus sp. OTE_8_concoct_300 TaxID=2964710 RepID=UPI00403F8409
MNNNNFHNSVYGSAFGANSQVHNHYGEQEFIEITIEDLESRFKETIEIPPDPLSKFNKILLEHRLLVLGGSLDVDKYELALQLAFTLAHNQMSTPNSQISQLTVKLWNRKSRQQFIDINTALENTKSPTIFVLKDVEPKNVASINWPQICQTAKSRNHYVLVSTERSFSGWNLGLEARTFFPELKIEEIYTEEILLKELTDKLNKDNFREELFKHLKRDGQKSIKSIAQELKTTNNISRFVQLFRTEVERFCDEKKLFVEKKQEIEPELIKIQELIQTAKNDEQFIRKLYYEILNPREQLLALGLSFFNGCFEDQLFAALERVVQDVWQKRDPALQAIDYCDLDKLENDYFQLAQNDLYESVPGDFKFVPTEAYKIDIRSIKILSQDNRKMLLKVAWETHRRQIVTALDVLVKLVEESVQENYYDQGKWELYGNSTRSEQLRCAIGETLSDIGLVSTSAFSSAEGCLLRLAMNEDMQVRNVAASAISGWYNRDNQQDPRLLFRILQTFYDITMEKERQAKKDENNYTGITKEINVKKNQNGYIEKNKNPPDKKGGIAAWIKSIIFEIFNIAKESEETEEKEYYIKSEKFEHQDYIGATVAVVVGDAIWNYDDGNGRLLKEFYKWLQELSESKLRLVHFFFCYHTLFYAVPLHFKEPRIREMLKTITQRHGDLLFKELQLPYSLNYAIARSLAHAYAWVENRNEVQTMLDRWYEEVKKRPSFIDRTKISEADALLKTVAITYGLIQYDEEPGRLTPKTAFERLSTIIKKEDHPIVREAVVFAICNQTRRYFKKVASHLQDLVANLNRDEGDKIVQTLTKIYLEERASLNDGDEKIKVNGRYYQIWTNLEKRPRTSIEKAMDGWAKDEQKPAAQEIAIQALVSFVKALEEQIYIQ